MKRYPALLCLAVLASIAHAQQTFPTGSPAVSHSLVAFPLYSVNAEPLAGATVQTVGVSGQSAYCYWAVANYQIGSVLSSLGCVSNANGALSSSNYNRISPWLYPAGVTSVDFLRTSGNIPLAPTGACNCAVATGVTSGAVNDQSNSLSSYTVTLFNPLSYALTLTNEVVGSQSSHLILRQGWPFPGTQVADLNNGGGGGTPGGTSHSVQINQTGSFGGIPAAPSGFFFTAAGTSNDPFWRSPAQLDVRAYGVTCDGITDDTAAMQAAVNATCTFSTTPKTLVMPNSCAVKLTSTLAITHCAGLTLDGGQSQGEASLSGGTGGPASFLWYGAAGGTAITINQTRDSTFKNFSVFTNALSNLVNGANTGILIDEIAPVTGIVTNNKFEDVQVFNGSSNSSFVGISICPTAPGNCEEQNFERLFINCSLFAATSSNNGIGIRYGAVGSATQPYGAYMSHFQPKMCSQAIDVELANRLHITNGLMDHNYTDLFLNGGRGIVYEDTRSENGTAQIVLGTAASSGVHDVELRHNSFSGLSNNTTTISFPFHGTGGVIRLIGNDWDSNATVTPFGPSGGGLWVGTVDSQDNNYPNATLCASFSLGLFIGINDSPQNGPCPYGSGVQLSGNSSLFNDNSLLGLVVASGTAALGTGAISSGTCAAAVTAFANGASLASQFVINNPGTGGTYNVGDTLQLTGGGGVAGGDVRVTAVSAGTVTQVVTTVLMPGTASTNIPTLNLTSSGTGATLDTVGDNISWTFQGDPTGLTGYAPAAGGALRIVAYPTANNVNFKVCNDTAGSITPGAAKLNWRVVR